MKKFLKTMIVVTALLGSVNPIASVYAADEINGDMTYEEGAEFYVPTPEDEELLKQKDMAVVASKKLRTTSSVKYTLAVPVFQQQNVYYCGPATVKQVMQFLNGSSYTQDHYANVLGTTSAGTDMTKISTYLKNWELNYVYASIGSYTTWLGRIEYDCKNKMPAILDINTKNVSAFPYNSSGHFVDTSGYDSTSTTRVRITDPYGPGLGNKWYTANDLYTANNNHFRQAMIW